MLIQQYADLAGFSFNDVTFDSVALGGLVIFDAAGSLDLGNTTFHDGYTGGDGMGDGTGFDIATSLNNIDATDVTFLDSSRRRAGQDRPGRTTSRSRTAWPTRSTPMLLVRW